MGGLRILEQTGKTNTLCDPRQPCRSDSIGAAEAGRGPAVLQGSLGSAAPGPLGNRPVLRLGGRFEPFALVEAAGVEPASGSVPSRGSTSLADLAVSPPA